MLYRGVRVSNEAVTGGKNTVNDYVYFYRCLHFARNSSSCKAEINLKPVASGLYNITMISLTSASVSLFD